MLLEFVESFNFCTPRILYCPGVSVFVCCISSPCSLKVLGNLFQASCWNSSSLSFVGSVLHFGLDGISGGSLKLLERF